MKKSEILKGRREISRICGKGEYFFFASILISAAALCVILVLLADSLFRSPEISEVYGNLIFKNLDYENQNLPHFLVSAINILKNFGVSALKSLPTAVVFVLVFWLLICPVYQGTIRWCAYLIEEGKPLPIRAILFYFLSPKFYFPCVLLSIKIFLKKIMLAIAFLLMPSLCIGLSLSLGSDYYGQNTLGALTLVLSTVWLILAVVLFFIYCEKYSAVRYLFALGFTRKLFKVSKEITEEKRGWLFTLRLRLLLNLPLAIFVVTAPLSLSRMIFGHCLCVKALICERRKTA